MINLDKEELELVIQLNAFDDTFSQYVHSRYSYQGSELVVGAKFRPASRVDDNGNLLIPLDEFHDYDIVTYP
jgi:inward rectifier potassium channel